MPRWHTVKAGDCLHSLAVEHGLKDWRRIYDDGNNAELRERRSDPALLLPGDRVYIPDVEQKGVDCAAGQSHRFVLKRPHMLLSLLLKDLAGEALANKRYRLEVEGERVEGTTGGDGKLEERIPDRAQQGDLWVWLGDAPAAEEPPAADAGDEDLLAPEDDQDVMYAPASQGEASQPPDVEADGEVDDTEGPHVVHFTLKLGHLDPHDTCSGLQQRLNNLGYPCSPSGELDDQTRAALRAFQGDQQLELTGEADDRTRSALKDSHAGT